MSYRFYAERVMPIGSKAGTIGVDTIIPVPGSDGLRLTIPYLSVSCGTTAQVLTILQVKDQDLITAFNVASKTVTTDTINDDLAGLFVAVEKTDGSWFFSKVASSAAKVHTLVDEPPADIKAEGRLFLFCSTTDELAQSVPLAASTQHELTAPAPGRFIARDFCFPVIIHITNATAATTVRGGSAVYISR